MDLIPIQGNVALGASELARYRSEVHPLPSGATMLLYTDGLVETRGESIEVGLERLREVSRGQTDPAALCAKISERMLGEDRADDVAMIAARVLQPPEKLTGTWPADRESLPVVRHQLRRWLLARGAGHDEAYDVMVATQEACANAVEHAYRPGRQTFSIEAVCEHGVIRVVVRDHGRWRPPRGTNRGRGLLLMSELMDTVDVRHTERGTEVVLERALGREAA